VSLRHAHLVFVTKYRRPVFTDEMLTFCENTMRAVCTELDVELVEFNGESDHVHLLVAYPPALAIATLVQRLKGRTAYAVRREYTGRCVRRPACADTSGRRPTPRSPAEAHRCRSSSKYIDGQAHPGQRRRRLPLSPLTWDPASPGRRTVSMIVTAINAPSTT
jgi:putative transposase